MAKKEKKRIGKLFWGQYLIEKRLGSDIKVDFLFK